MKLLLDQNLSFKLCDTLKSIFPEIIHVNISEKAIVKGFPPKTIWIKKGNCSTKEIEKILRNKFLETKSFSEDNINSILILT